NAVGLAIAERMLAARFNQEPDQQPGHAIVDHRTYVIASDGDLMEGVASEASSLAGFLRLGKLTVIYDDNHITIEGDTGLAFSEDVAARYRAYGWQVLAVADGNDLPSLRAALAEANAEALRPSLIVMRTHIAYGSPNKQDTAGAHGAPLGEDEVRLTKERLGWAYPEPFTVPAEVRASMGEAVDRGRRTEAAWRQAFEAYRAARPALAAEFERRTRGDLPAGWESVLPSFPEGGQQATRTASGAVLAAIAPVLPELAGGSADLAPSNDTYLKGLGDIGPGKFGGRNFHFGIREHGMGAVMNGLTVHHGLRVYGGTFLVFSDYMRASIRLAALSHLPAIYVFTHDSIGLGEDGPTHQPVEHLAALRAIPNLVVLRPADANETAAAWRVAVARSHGPTAIILTRQRVAVLRPGGAVERGAYVYEDGRDVTLIGTGSEVGVCIAARALLGGQGVSARVVSMPSWELFAEQPEAYRAEVLPPGVPRLSVEAGTSFGWSRWANASVSIDRFGASAPGEVTLEQFGFTPQNVAAQAQALLGR
ncbi:MAG: transketolase, partial [Chloroflexota bacterium]